jgi:hypothetical protein
MHEDSLNHEQDETMALELAAVNVLEQRLTHALEAPPKLSIPSDFAARVAGRLPATVRPITVTATHYGYNAILISMVLLMAVLVAMASHATRSALEDTMLWLVFGQFIALTVWFSGWRRSLR